MANVQQKVQGCIVAYDQGRRDACPLGAQISLKNHRSYFFITQQIS
jgi:hypothetical protein